jgi:1-deoxy-D-xylulose-5-phosphate synthase
MIICAPKDEIELRNIMYTASLGLKNPIAIRYPRGRGKNLNWNQSFQKISLEEVKCLNKGKEVAILSTGTIVTNIEEAISKLDPDKTVSHYHFPFIKPINEKELHSIFKYYSKIITVEDGSIKGGFGSSINSFVTKNEYKKKIVNLGIPDNFIEHGSVSELQQICKLDPNFIHQTIITI